MKIAVLGSGGVAQTLADGFLKHGHGVWMGTREPGKLEAFARGKGGLKVVAPEAAARAGDLAVLAVKGSAAAAALRGAGPENLAGKVVIDVTNPIQDAPPEDGVLRFFTTLDDSLMERLQREFQTLRFVKAFNSVGAGRMVNPAFQGGRPTMFICGDDPAAKRDVAGLLDAFGWDAADMGSSKAARAIEPLCMLWCIRGFRDNRWDHAFKLLT